MSPLGGFGVPPRVERPARERMVTRARAYLAAVAANNAAPSDDLWAAYLVANEAWREVLNQYRAWHDQQGADDVAEAVLAAARERAARSVCPRADEELRRLWLAMRNDAGPVAMTSMRAVIAFARATGALSDDQAELWVRRIATCPGHGDEGGRAWCAYCGNLPPEVDDEAPAP